MKRLAHRGCHESAPENSLAAFAEAARRGADGIETDLRLSAEGRLVLVHDRLVGETPVGELSQAELSARSGHAIATADEALAAFPDLLWNLEIKEPAALPATIELLRRYAASRKLLVSSFWHDLALAVRQAVEVDVALLVAHRPLDARRAAWGFSGAPLHGIVWYFGAVDETALRQAADSGLANYVYGPVSTADHEQCRAWPLAGVITDWLERG